MGWTYEVLWEYQVPFMCPKWGNFLSSSNGWSEEVSFRRKDNSFESKGVKND